MTKDYIDEPPHSAGRRLEGIRPLVQEKQIPSIIEVFENDQRLWRDQTYFTCSSNQAIPLVTSDFTVVDQGNSSPRFIRASTCAWPNSKKMADSCHIPLGIMLQPFAQQKEEEESVPVVDFSVNGPPRCTSCRGFINPWCLVKSNDQKWICNLCESDNNLSSEYTCTDTQPELQKGSVDFAVSPDYWAREVRSEFSNSFVFESSTAERRRIPQTLSTVFVIDTSWKAVRSGSLKNICASILAVMYKPDRETSHSLSQVAFVSFDEHIYFHRISASDPDIQTFVVTEKELVYLPLPSQCLFVDPHTARTGIERLLQNLGNSRDELAQRSSMSSALAGGIALLAKRGGRMLVFSASPSTADLQYKHIRSTDNPSVWAPQNNSWLGIAEEAVRYGISASLLLSFDTYADLRALSIIPRMTGGTIYVSDKVFDAKILQCILSNLCQRGAAFDCMVRLRVSSGIHSYCIDEYDSQSPSEVRIGMIDSERSIAFALEHDPVIIRQTVFLQAAVLYTSVTGQRRVRCHNLAIPVSEMVANVFRFSDSTTIMCLWIRRAVKLIGRQTGKQLGELIMLNCVQVLSAYRKLCAPSIPITQLVLPEAFKLLPLYSLCWMKSHVVKAMNAAEDMRHYYIFHFSTISPKAMVTLLYPQLVQLHCTVHKVAMNWARATHKSIRPDGIYLIDNGIKTMIWIGQDASKSIVGNLFCKEIVDASTMRQFVESLSECIPLGQHADHMLSAALVRQNIDGSELEFGDLLVEDQNNDALSYADYLCFIHSKIKLSLGG